MKLIHQGSQGIPRTISVICDNALTNGSRSSTPGRSGDRGRGLQGLRPEHRRKPALLRQPRPAEPVVIASANATRPRPEPERRDEAVAGASLFSSFTRRRRFSFFRSGSNCLTCLRTAVVPPELRTRHESYRGSASACRSKHSRTGQGLKRQIKRVQIGGRRVSGDRQNLLEDDEARDLGTADYGAAAERCLGETQSAGLMAPFGGTGVSGKLVVSGLCHRLSSSNTVSLQ